MTLNDLKKTKNDLKCKRSSLRRNIEWDFFCHFQTQCPCCLCGSVQKSRFLPSTIPWVCCRLSSRMESRLLLFWVFSSLMLSVKAQRTVESIFDNIDKDYNKNVPPPPTGRRSSVMIGITVTLIKPQNDLKWPKNDVKCNRLNNTLDPCPVHAESRWHQHGVPPWHVF